MSMDTIISACKEEGNNTSLCLLYTCTDTGVWTQLYKK